MDEYLLKYKEKDNVKDKLKELKTEVSKKTLDTDVQKDSDKKKEAETFFGQLDTEAEKDFDFFITNNWKHVKELLNNNKLSDLKNEFNNELFKT
jgi:hypothetical protein